MFNFVTCYSMIWALRVVSMMIAAIGLIRAVAMMQLSDGEAGNQGYAMGRAAVPLVEWLLVAGVFWFIASRMARRAKANAEMDAVTRGVK